MWRLLGVLAALAVGVTAIVAFVMVCHGQDWAVGTLTALGGVATLAGLVWGASALVKEYRSLVEDLDQIAEITKRKDLRSDQQAKLRDAVRPPSSTWVDVAYLKEWIRRLILEHTMQSLKYPAVLTMVGVLCSSAAGVWSVWVK